MNIRYILLAATAMFAAGCSQNEPIMSGELQQEVRVTAGAGPGSRITLNDGGDYTRTLWQKGDKITLFTSTQRNLVYSTSIDSTSTTADFTPTGEALKYIEGNTVYSGYPEVSAVTEDGMTVSLPSSGTLVYDNGTLRSFAYAVGSISKGSVNFTFKHISAFLCLTLTPDMLASTASNVVGGVTVSTSSSIPLSVGEWDTFDFTTLTANTTSGGNTVQVLVDGGRTVDSNWTLYIPILPQPADATITITITGTDGSTLYTQSKQAPSAGFLAGNVYMLTQTDVPEEENSADVAYIYDGKRFNELVKELANGQYLDYDSIIRHIEFVTEEKNVQEEYVQIEYDNDAPIYASFNKNDSLLTVYTPAKRIEILDASYLFSSLVSLSTIDGDFKITKTTTDMSNTFGNCSSLTSLDVSNWDTSNVTDIGGLFSGCSALASLNVSNWNTSNVTNMGSVFSGCSALTSLDVSNWDTSNVTNLQLTFDGCLALTSLDLSKWNTGKVVNMFGAFWDCRKLGTLNLSNWDVSNVEDMRYMFLNCDRLSTFSASNWNTSNVTTMYFMFGECDNLKTVYISNWDTSNLENMGGMFYECYNLSTLDVSNWNTSKVQYMSSMFLSCINLVQVDVSNWDVSNVTKMDKMFYYCSSLESLDVSKWSTEHVTDMSKMFYECSALTSLDMSNWITTDTTNMERMFYDCTSLANVIMGGKVTFIGEDVFMLCRDLTNVIMSDGLKSIGDYAFYGCYDWESCNLPSTVTSIGKYSFQSCSKLGSVTCQAITPPTIGIGAWEFIPSSATLYVPKGSASVYKESDWATYFTNIIEIE